MKKHLYWISICCLFSCTTSRLVKPLPEKKVGIAFHMGGPLIKFGGATLPVPLSSVTGAYGLCTHTSVFGSVHTTALLFGTAFVDLGVVREVIKPDGYIPGVSVSPVVNISTDFYKFNTKLWPQLDLNAYWDYGKNKKHFVYIGINNWFELASRLPGTDQNQPHHWFFTPQVGNTFVTDKWRYTLEMKWSAANIHSTYNVADYRSIAQKGAVGLYVSIMRYF